MSQNTATTISDLTLMSTKEIVAAMNDNLEAINNACDQKIAADRKWRKEVQEQVLNEIHNFEVYNQFLKKMFNSPEEEKGIGNLDVECRDMLLLKTLHLIVEMNPENKDLHEVVKIMERTLNNDDLNSEKSSSSNSSSRKNSNNNIKPGFSTEYYDSENRSAEQAIAGEEEERAIRIYEEMAQHAADHMSYKDPETVFLISRDIKVWLVKALFYRLLVAEKSLPIIVDMTDTITKYQGLLTELQDATCLQLFRRCVHSYLKGDSELFTNSLFEWSEAPGVIKNGDDRIGIALLEIQRQIHKTE